MNQERSPQSDEASANKKNYRRFASQNLANNSHHSLLNSPIENCNPLDSTLELKTESPRWSSFSQGLFWGGIFGFTALFSASCGIALTRIDPVEQAIAQKLNLNSAPVAENVNPGLTRPIDLLVLEVEPQKNSPLKSDRGLTGESKTILLVQFHPQANVARVINIPPNTRVKIPGFGWGTIADAHRYGGTELVFRTISQLMDGIKIDRYIKATPDTFQKLIASGKITLQDCAATLGECSNPQEQILRQKKSLETIRQRLNIPTYLRTFKLTLTKTKPDLDTNLSVPEALSLANFVKELESDRVSVDLVEGYVAGQTINISDRLSKSPSDRAVVPTTSDRSLNQGFSFHHRPIAIQNTTDNPELGMRFVAYLRSQNFQDVYLVEHIPLRLNRTKIIISPSQLSRAKHLQKTMGFGSLESKSRGESQPLTIQIGEDADRLPLTNNY